MEGDFVDSLNLVKSYLLRGVAGTLMYCVAGYAYITTGLCDHVSTNETPELSVREKEELVEKAVALYDKKEIAKARESLERAQIVFPENYAVPYYLGLIYLEKGDRQNAVTQWRRYVKISPQNETALKIRGSITLLLRAQAHEYSKRVVAQEAALQRSSSSDKSIAVLRFNHKEHAGLGPIGKGVASLVMADLARLPGLQVVDRIKIQALIEEMKLGASEMVDAEVASKVGNLLNAKHVATGMISDFENDPLVLETVVVNADQSARIGTQEVRGAIKQFFDLEKQLACQIIEDIGKNCYSAPASFNKIHTKSIPALVMYSLGLDLFDQAKYDEAQEMFTKALEEDPQFELASVWLMSTPTSFMASLNMSQLISYIAAMGISSDRAGTATPLGGNVIEQGIATSIGKGALFLTPVISTLGGTVLIGGMALGGGGGGDVQGEPPNADLTGQWSGNWSTGADSGEITFSLMQTDNTIVGTMSISGYHDCLTDGNVSGSVSEENVNLTIWSNGENITATATIGNPSNTMQGSWTHSASSVGCNGLAATFSLIFNE
jgi:tetratricopeptide (TPR) repeat protein